MFRCEQVDSCIHCWLSVVTSKQIDMFVIISQYHRILALVGVSNPQSILASNDVCQAMNIDVNIVSCIVLNCVVSHNEHRCQHCNDYHVHCFVSSMSTCNDYHVHCLDTARANARSSIIKPSSSSFHGIVNGISYSKTQQTQTSTCVQTSTFTTNSRIESRCHTSHKSAAASLHRAPPSRLASSPQHQHVSKIRTFE